MQMQFKLVNPLARCHAPFLPGIRHGKLALRRPGIYDNHTSKNATPRLTPIVHAAFSGDNFSPRDPAPSLRGFISRHKASITFAAILATTLVAILLANSCNMLPITPYEPCAVPSTISPSVLASGGSSSPMTASLTTSLQPVISYMSKITDMLFDRISLVILRMSYQPVWLKLANIFLVGLPLVALLGVALAKVSNIGIRDATLKIYALLYRAPGASAIHETSVIGLLIVNLAYFGGLFVFAVLIGFVGDEIKSQMKSAKSGDYALHHRDHLLVLNWNRNTVPLLRQIASARSDPGSPYWGRPVVVMANVDKQKMDSEIENGLRDFSVEVHTRQGVPFRMCDLRHVNAAAASTLILLHPEDSTSKSSDSETTEAGKAATLMSLCNLPGARGQGTSTNLVVQGSADTPSEASVVQSLLNSPGTNKKVVLQLRDKDIINRLVAQTAMQPGLANVYSEIIQQGKGRARALFQKVPATLGGSSYGTVRRHYSDALVMGFLSSSTGKLAVNPADDAVVGSSDKLLLLARKYDMLTPHNVATEVFEAAAVKVKNQFEAAGSSSEAKAKPRKIIIAGWSESDLPLLLPSLEQFAVPGSHVTVITRQPIAKTLTGWSKNCSFRQVVARYPTAVQTLLDAGIKDATAVVVGGLEEYTDSEAESRVLAALVQVQDASRAAARSCAPHVVAKVRQPNTAKVARQYLSTMWASGAATAPTPTAEFLLPEEFIGAIISQVAGDADYDLLMLELLDSAEGQEIYLHPPAVYCIQPGSSVSFAEVQEAARLRQQTALGFLRYDGTCVLVPDSFSQHTLREGDNVIVLAEDYVVRKYTEG